MTTSKPYKLSIKFFICLIQKVTLIVRFFSFTYKRKPQIA